MLMMSESRVMRYTTTMKSHEGEPQHSSSVDFRRALDSLPDGHFLVLTPQGIEFAHEGYSYRYARVSYEGLSLLSDTYQAPTGGVAVTSEFMTASQSILAVRDQELLAPRLTVINNTNGHSATKEVSLPHLIADLHEPLPIYSRPDQATRRGEQFVLPVHSLLRYMAEEVGVHSRGLVVVDNDDVGTYREIITPQQAFADVTYRQGRDTEVIEEVRWWSDEQRRGAAVLYALQMSVNEQLGDSRYRVGEKGRTGHTPLELAVRVDSQVPVEPVLTELINVLVSHGMKLVVRNEERVAGVEHRVFVAVPEGGGVSVQLSSEPTLDIAIHNAYSRAEALFGQ